MIKKTIQDDVDSDTNPNVDFYFLVVTNEGKNYEIKVFKAIEGSVCYTGYKFNLTLKMH